MATYDIEFTAGLDTVNYEQGTKKIEVSATAMSRIIQKQQTEFNRLAKLERQVGDESGYLSRALDKLTNDFREVQTGVVSSNNQFASYIDTVRRSTTAIASNGKANSRAGMLVQQAGYQVGDFAVQVQSGTNAWVAFGQQATQIAGSLTLLGGRMLFIGSALGIAIPLVTGFMAYWSRTREKLDESSNSAKELTEEIKALDSAIKDWARTREALSQNITGEELLGNRALTEAKDNARTLRVELEELERFLESMGGTGSQRDFGISSKDIEDAANRQRIALEEYGVALERIAAIEDEMSKRRFQNFSTEYSQLQDKIRLLEIEQRVGENSYRYRAESLRQEIAAYNAVIDRQVESGKLTVSQGEALKRSNAELLKTQTNYSNLKAFVQEVLERIIDAKDAAIDLKNVTEGINFAGAIAGATTLYNRLVAAAKQASAMSSIESGSFSDENLARSGYGGAYTSMRDSLMDLNSGVTPDWVGTIQSSGSGGGGGSSKSAADIGYGSLARSLMDETQLLEIWREESLEKLAEFNAKELEMLGGHAEAKRLIEEEYQRKKQDIEATARSATLSGYADLFGALGNVMGTGGKRLLMIQAGLDAAATMISSYRAAADSAAKAPTIAGKYAVWASWVAKGVSAVAQIKQIASSGSASGGSISGGSSSSISTYSSSSSSQAPQRVLIEGLSSDSVFTGDMLSRFFDNFIEENSERGYIFQVSN